MGFLKKLFIIFFAGLFLVSCSKLILLEGIPGNTNSIEQFGGSSQRNFYHPINVSDSLEFVWDASTIGSYDNTTLSAIDRYLFVPTLVGRIYCIDANTGLEIGVEKENGEVPIAPVVYRKRFFYLNNISESEKSEVLYYDFLRANIISRVELEEAVENEMVKTDEGILIVTNSGKLLKINYIGQIDYEIETKVQTFFDPAGDSTNIFWANQNGEIISARISDGRLNYRKKISNGFESGAIIENGKVFLGDNDGIFYCVDFIRGQVVWKFLTGGKIKSVPSLDEKYVYIGNLNGTLYSIEKENGALNWETISDGLYNTPPLLFNNILVQVNQKNKVEIRSKKDGKLLRQIEFRGRVKMTPIYYNNMIYFGVDKGEIHAYKFAE